MSVSKPAFLITIDTEGDNLWSRPATVTTRNAEFIPRFQTLCERYCLKPTYLTNWEMANSRPFQEFAAQALKRGTAEVGMHLHAWNSPPLDPLTSDDERHQPFLIDYPVERMRDKIAAMTDVLETNFGVKMLSHRAGRWSFDEQYAKILVEQGYTVDCSVTPHVSWKTEQGDPNGAGGTDFTAFPDTAYFVDPADIRRPGIAPLLEVPMTIYPVKHSAPARVARKLLSAHRLGRRAVNFLLPTAHWIRPDGRNRGTLLRLLQRARADRREYVEFMLHSSEFMPGGSPRFQTEQSIEALYDDMEALFSEAASHFRGETLAEFRQRYPQPEAS